MRINPSQITRDILAFPFIILQIDLSRNLLLSFLINLSLLRFNGPDYFGPICFRFSQTHLDNKVSEDFLTFHVSLLVVQFFEADYHKSENKRCFWLNYRLLLPVNPL